jgi:hypothetical protein
MDEEARKYLLEQADEVLNFARANGTRHDWHEPDEQDVTADVSGGRLDNAGTNGEIVVIINGPKSPDVVIHLATLLAIAADYARIMETKNEV